MRATLSRGLIEVSNEESLQMAEMKTPYYVVVDWDGETYAKSEFMFGMWDALRGIRTKSL